MGYIVFILFLMVSLYALTFKGKNAVKFLTIICFFQNIVLVLLARYLTGTTFTLIALIKEMYVVMYIFCTIYRKKYIRKSSVVCCSIIGIYLLCMFLYGEGELKGMLTSFRQLYLPFLFFVFGECCELTEEDSVDIIRFYVKCCIIACLFGIVEMLLGDGIWGIIGLPAYAKVKGIQDTRLRNGLFRAFYTFDFGKGIRRMASVLVDPVILGQLLALGLIFSLFVPRLYSNPKKKVIISALLMGGMIFTFAKGGIIIASLSICILLGQVTNRKYLSKILLLLAGVIIVAFTSYSVTNELSGNNHLNGLISGVQTVIHNPLGTGIGSAGNMADAYSGFDGQSVAGDESYIGSLMAQLGWIGIIANIWFWMRFFKREKGKTDTDNLIRIIKVLNISLLFTSLVNYTAISFTSCFLFIILAAHCKYTKTILPTTKQTR